MSADRNKIAQELTPAQLGEFVAGLAALPGKERTLAQIQEKAAGLGITISLMSAKAFRDTTFDRHLADIKRAQEIASQVEDIDRGGSTIADASAKMVAKRIFDQLRGEDEVDLDQMTLAISRLRTGDVASRTLRLKIEDYERREREREEKKAALSKTLSAASEKKGGLTADTLKEIEAQLAML